MTSVMIRGASSDKTLVLVAGRRVERPHLPGRGLRFLQPGSGRRRRIEVLSGPQGSLWGSDAIGGVVSITTREPDGLHAGGEAGSFGTERAYGSAGVADAARAVGGQRRVVLHRRDLQGRRARRQSRARPVPQRHRPGQRAGSPRRTGSAWTAASATTAPMRRWTVPAAPPA
ncbi:MAG: TonB-dependent receptor plug domain-containing protein [Caulobacteraceae bacterium]